MATISLYAGPINQMAGLIKNAQNSVKSFNNELKDIHKKALGVDSSVCDLSEVISSIQASSQTQDERTSKLETFKNNCEEFVNETVRIDGEVAINVNQTKNDFYEKYDYLKPECEKSRWEKLCDYCVKVGDWCKEHWKAIVTAVVVVVSVVAICTGVGAIFTAAAWGAIFGAGIGGVTGGLQSMAAGGSFWEGFENGAFSGALSGALMGGAMAGIGMLGASLGNSVSCLSHLGKAIKVTASVTKAMSTIMGGFDTLAMMDNLFGIFGGNLASFNAKLRSNKAYNIFQFSVTALAAFTGGMASTMSCFVAGTLVLTANGLVAIESIKAGDKVISTDPDTGKTEEKTVLEAFHRTVTELVHLKIGDEIITTTHNHPFYVVGKGFVNAGKIRENDTLIDMQQNNVFVSDISFESSRFPTIVFNISVEDFHSYFVGGKVVLVHNADCAQIINDVESGKTELKSTKEKGNYGEMKMDQELRDKGYTRISAETVDSLDAAGHRGIDGVYYNEDGTPQYIIGEAKYGSSQLGYTRDGRQMSDKWIANRIDDALGNDPNLVKSIKSEMILNPDNVGTNLYHINIDGSVDTISLTNGVK